MVTCSNTHWKCFLKDPQGTALGQSSQYGKSRGSVSIPMTAALLMIKKAMMLCHATLLIILLETSILCSKHDARTLLSFGSVEVCGDPLITILHTGASDAFGHWDFSAFFRELIRDKHTCVGSHRSRLQLWIAAMFSAIP